MGDEPGILNHSQVVKNTYKLPPYTYGSLIRFNVYQTCYTAGPQCSRCINFNGFGRHSNVFYLFTSDVTENIRTPSPESQVSPLIFYELGKNVFSVSQGLGPWSPAPFVRRGCRIIGKLEEGRSVTSVAAEHGIAHSIVSRLWRQFQTTGTAIWGFSSGRPRGTTPADDRYIVLQARRNRQGEKSLDTRHRRLDNRYRVLPWPEDCTVVVCLHDALYDESRFSLSSDSHRILIWRERGSRNPPSNIIERDRYGGRGVLVWGGIMLGSRTDLHIFDAGSVNGTRYCNEILLPYVRLFRGAMGLQFLFMDDNAPCHRTVAAEQLLESEDIERMDWPARSPDLNPIEHKWDFLGRRLAARTLPPVTIRELRLALQDEWAAMPQQLINTLILSMGRRCETCLAVRGDHIPFLAGHPSQGCFGLQSHCAPCYFFNQASFYPSDFSFSKCCLHITHVLTYWGSYGIKCVDLESFCTKLY
ncbi:transposable element Tcb2 transposase [Trichonephila clavipes]|nr:transposable element Tcb2 transposase [Trichonephila clavipes]